MKLGKTSLGPAALLASIALLSPAPLAAAPQAPSAREREREERTASWIEQLGAPDHEIRERAWETLLGRGAQVLPDLEKAAKEGKDPEVRWNARLLAREIRRKEVTRQGPVPPPVATARPQTEPLLRDFEDLRRRVDDFGDLHRQMEEMHERLEAQLRGVPHGAFHLKGNSVRVEQEGDGPVRVEVTEKRDGEDETKTYEAPSWEEFRKNYPEVVERYGLDGSGRAFSFHFGPRGNAGAWFDASPFLSSPALPGGPRLGVFVEPADEEASKAAGAEEGVGLVVRHVEPGSLAEAMEIHPGDLLLKIGEKPIRGTETLRTALAASKAGETVRVEVFREGEGTKVLSAPKRRASRTREL